MVRYICLSGGQPQPNAFADELFWVSLASGCTTCRRLFEHAYLAITLQYEYVMSAPVSRSLAHNNLALSCRPSGRLELAEGAVQGVSTSHDCHDNQC